MHEKIKANSQRPHLLNLWVQHPMHLSVIYTMFFSCIYTEDKAAPCLHCYGCGKWLYLAYAERMPETELELICHGTALDQHCEAILCTEERVPWLEAWWICRAKEHVV